MLLPLTAAALARWNHCQLCIGIGTLTVIGPPLGTDGTERIQLWNLLSFVVFFEDRWAFFLLIRTTCTAQAAPELSTVSKPQSLSFVWRKGWDLNPRFVQSVHCDSKRLIFHALSILERP